MQTQAPLTECVTVASAVEGFDADPAAAVIEEARRWNRRRRRRQAIVFSVLLLVTSAAAGGGVLFTRGGRDSNGLYSNLAPPNTPAAHVLYLATQQPYPMQLFVVPGADGSIRFNQTFKPQLLALRSARRRLVKFTQVEWFDPSKRVLHQLSFVDGVLTSSDAFPARGSEMPVAELNALQPFARSGGYRHLLASGGATIAGHGRFQGRPITLIDVPIPNAAIFPEAVRRGRMIASAYFVQVAVDPSEHRPVAIRVACNRCFPGQPLQALLNVKIVSATSPLLNGASHRSTAAPKAKQVAKLIRAHATLIQSGSQVFAVEPSREHRQHVALSQVERVLPGGALWPGKSVGGLAARNATLTTATTRKGAGRGVQQARILQISYGAVEAPLGPVVNATVPPSVQITETTTPGFRGDGIAFTVHDRRVWTLDGIPVPQHYALLLSAYPYWTIQLRHGRLFITITATSRTLAVAAATRLSPA